MKKEKEKKNLKVKSGKSYIKAIQNLENKLIHSFKKYVKCFKWSFKKC